MIRSSTWLAACLILSADSTLVAVDRPSMNVPYITGALTVDGSSADWSAIKQAGRGKLRRALTAIRSNGRILPGTIAGELTGET